ncbi:MAG: hypothetical protein NTX22_14190 [Ignavibacteriales bacterium]|nr:hypothetical protein [Ignavibacteriales bacterium]
MKKFIFVITFCFTTINYSQDEMGWDAKFAIGIGYTPGWIIPNYNGINEKLTNFGVEKFSSAGLFVTGQAGYISIAVIKNVRIGGMGLSGSISHSGSKDGFYKEAKYSTSMGGLTIEYSIPFIKNVAVSFGAMFGLGNTTLELYQNKGTLDWNSAWDEVTNPDEKTQNINRKLSNSFFTITPTLNIDIPFYRFFAFRVGGGYMLALGKNWKADNNQALNGIPSNLNSNALFLQAGIFIGYFNY